MKNKPIQKAKKMNIRFVCLKHLEQALLYQKIVPCEKKMKIPMYQGIKEKGKTMPSLNIFNPDGTVYVKAIKYVQITAPVELISEIKMSDYQFKGHELKLKAPNYLTPAHETVALELPIEIFEVMLCDTRICMPEELINKGKLSSLLYYVNNAYSIRLLTESKKEIAYALQMVE